MVRPTGQEIIATEKALYYSQSPRAMACCVTQGHLGKHLVSQEAEVVGKI